MLPPDWGVLLMAIDGEGNPIEVPSELWRSENTIRGRSLGLKGPWACVICLRVSASLCSSCFDGKPPPFDCAANLPCEGEGGSRLSATLCTMPPAQAMLSRHPEG